MANGAHARERLEEFLLARIPFVSVRTAERGRVLELLAELNRSRQFDILIHTLSQGLRDIRTQSLVSDDRSFWGALEFAAQQFQARRNLTIVFTDVPQIGDDNETTRRFLDLANLAEGHGGCVIVITSEPVWVTLQRAGMSVSLDVPDQDEMSTLIHEFLVPYTREITFTWDEKDYQQAASILTGVTKTEAENILATLVARKSITRDDLGRLSRAKDNIFSDLAGIERVELREEYRLGGLSGLRAWLERKRPLLTMDLRSRGMRPPRGVLLMGVPGCGKSLSAKAIASDWNLPLYRLDIASIFGQYLGQTENRFKDALATADNVAPCVLWIDEIEKGLAGSGTDSTGVTTRIVGQFLYWLQESPARVFVVATANDVRSLPPELLRSGRFDDLFFVDLPPADDRREIIEIYFARHFPGQPLPQDLLDKLVVESAGFAGSDIAAACKEAAEESVRNGSPEIPIDYAMEAFANIVPLSVSAPERIEEVRRLADRALPAGGGTAVAELGARGRRVVLQ